MLSCRGQSELRQASGLWRQQQTPKAMGIGSMTRAAVPKAMIFQNPAIAAGISVPVAAVIKRQWVLSFHSPRSRRLASKYGWVLQAPGIP